MVDDPRRYYQNKDVAEQYDEQRFSSTAGRVFQSLEKYNVRKAFRGLAENSTILDVPCGTGRLAEHLLKAGYRVIGMDISSSMLAQAQKRLARFGDRFSCQTVDMFDPELPAGTKYDAALCARVLMHFPLEEQIIFLRNLGGLVGDRVVFTQSWHNGYYHARRKVKRFLGHQPSVNYPISAADLKQLLHQSHLREMRRFRPCAPVTEEIIITAEPI